MKEELDHKLLVDKRSKRMATQSLSEYKNNLNLVVLDLETTGLAAKTDKIIEIGAVRIRNGKVDGEFSKLIQPGFPLEQRTIDITGITDEMLKAQPGFELIANELLDFIQEDILLGHNIIFDYSFLKKSVINCMPKGTKFERNGIDTLKIARCVLEPECKKTLPALCEKFQITYHPHRALEDAKATWTLFEHLLNEYYEKYAQQFEPRVLNYQVKRDTPIMQKQIDQIKRLHEQYQLPLTRDLTCMTKSEASRYMDRMKTSLVAKRNAKKC